LPEGRVLLPWVKGKRTLSPSRAEMNLPLGIVISIPKKPVIRSVFSDRQRINRNKII